jgi:hypothetical protein
VFRDFEAETDGTIHWIKRKLCNAETEIKISLYTENFHSLNGNIFVSRDFEAETDVKIHWIKRKVS